MNPTPICMTCVHWHVCDRCDGWCTLLNKLTEDNDYCKKHVPVKIEPIDKLMKKPLPELIAFLENYNRWRRGSYVHEQPVSEELGQRLDQAVELLKAMTWQPMETAPKDREFLCVWGPNDIPPAEFFDVFLYDKDEQNFTFSHGDAFLPSETCQLFAWMEIPKYES